MSSPPARDGQKNSVSELVSAPSAIDIVDELRHAHAFSASLLRRAETRDAPEPKGAPEWSRAQLEGRWIELSGLYDHATVTLAAALTGDHHRHGELVAWVRLTSSCAHPPDLESWGIDLEALAIITALDAAAATRATYHLLSASAFALVVLDLMDLGKRVTFNAATQGRFVKLAQRHATTLLCLTHKGCEHASLGAMVSLRGQTQLAVAGPGQLHCRLRVLKDKRRGPGWQYHLRARSPLGMV